MNDTKKTKIQLMKELEALRLRVAELETAESERKRKEGALKESCDFVQAIIDGIGDPTLVIDIRSHSILLSNKAAEIKNGLDSLETGLTCYQALHRRGSPCEEPEEPCPMQKILETGSPARVTHIHHDSAGNEVYVDILATPVFNREGKIVQVIESCRDITERVELEKERERLIAELQDALAKIKTLKGLIPVCAWCNKARDDKGYWDNLENYIRDHSDADFTHGICPDCLQKMEEEDRNIGKSS